MDFRSNEDLRAAADIREEYEPLLLTQYAASPHISALVRGFREAFSNAAGIELFYKNVFDIDTATGAGLDVWGAIVGISRIVADEETGVSVTLSDDVYRLLIKYKAAANIASADAATLNRLINSLLPNGSAFVLETPERGPMTIRWVFNYHLSPEEKAIFKVAGTLCRGAGVGWEWYEIAPGETFGFSGSDLQPFDQGTFSNGIITRS